MDDSENDLPPIEWGDPPGESDEDFKRVMACDSYRIESEPMVKEHRVRDPSDQLEGRQSYASFGSDGTTASVTAYGNIMQISRFLGFGRSGFFCANSSKVTRPYVIQERCENLFNMSTTRDVGTRIEWKDAFGDQWDFNKLDPSLEWIYGRWPRFNFRPSKDSEQIERSELDQGLSHKFDFSLQYFCSQGTIFQQNILKRKKSVSITAPRELKIRTDFLIRNLDFTEPTNYNWVGSNGHSHKFGPHHLGFVVFSKISLKAARRMGMDDADHNNSHGIKAAGLVVTPFANGTAQKVKQCDDSWVMELSPQVQQEFELNGTLDVTIAYRLQAMESKQSWMSSIVPASDLSRMLNAFSVDSSVHFKRVRFSSHQQLDFVIRRNMEHILSVCSIPVYRPQKHGADDLEATQAEFLEKGDLPISLTCGDMSCHRVAASASFFAFQFLISIVRYLDGDKGLWQFMSDESLQNCSCGDQEKLCEVCRDVSSCLDDLRKRTRVTCQRHIKWVCEETEATKDGRFSPHYWATGKIISNCDYLPPQSLVDTPLQILKVWEVFDDAIFKELSKENVITDCLRKKIRPWIKALDRENMRGKYAFPRNTDSINKKFHLADHVWICRAIKCIEDLGLQGQMERFRPEEDPEKQSQELCIFNKYSSEMRRIVFKRFKTENTFSKQRMLATCRTSSESRFLFHSKDTVLFHAMEAGFFDGQDGQAEQESRDSNIQEREKKSKSLGRRWKRTNEFWRNTVDAQSFQDEYQDLDWDKPLWYALVFIMSARKHRVKKASADEVLSFTSSFLFAKSNYNGLFPGLLDVDRQPISFQDEFKQDNYWSTMFETPYILWSYGKDHLEGRLGTHGGRPTGPNSDLETRNVLAKEGEKPGQISVSTKDNGKTGRVIAKTMSFANFTSLIDQKGLVEISDDWLQDGPSALNFEFEPEALRSLDPSEPQRFSKSIRTILKELPETGTNFREILYSYMWDQAMFFSGPLGKKGVVIDVPRNSPGTEIERPQLTIRELLSALKKRRTVQDAKKRVVWLPDGDKEAALFCFLASPQPEWENMSTFFYKHSTHNKSFFDGTTADLNVWETELHLSFFQILDSSSYFDERRTTGMPNKSFVKLKERTGARGAMSETTIAQRTMSFRFIGDFFDRYWTCHFLEHDLEESNENATLNKRLSKLDVTQLTTPGKNNREKNPWQQRKVLELLLFSEMLKAVSSSTAKILKWAQEATLGASNGESTASAYEMRTVFDKDPFKVDASYEFNPLARALLDGFQISQQGTGENYFSVIERWRFFEQILQAVEDDLRENLEIISQWSRREKDREPERPRWTRHDEKAYRPAITKLLVLNQKQIRDLECLQASIKSFRDSLTSRLSSIREDISFRGSENINLFTYVTVIFLPLGFATGIFSMSEAPSHSTLVKMVELAFIAMAITIFALANAKTTGRDVVQPIIWLFRRINNLVLYPIVQASYFIWNRLSTPAIFVFCRYVSNPLADRWKLKDEKENYHDTMVQPGGNMDPAKEAAEDYVNYRKNKRVERIARMWNGIRESGPNGEVKCKSDKDGIVRQLRTQSSDPRESRAQTGPDTN